VKVTVDLSALGGTRWYEYALRFALGGAATVATGLIARHFGPEIGGLFLAFPAIFPASATLVEKHEAEKKRRAGISHTERGRQAAGLDAAGTTLGGIALMGFAFVVYKGLPGAGPWLVLAAASLLWLLIATSLWGLRKKHVLSHRRAE
jgi:hypothetical protein